MSNRHNEIVILAYEIYERRGGMPGRDLDDWLEAERLVIIPGNKAADTAPDTVKKKTTKKTVKTEKPAETKKKPLKAAAKTTAKTTKKAPAKKKP